MSNKYYEFASGRNEYYALISGQSTELACETYQSMVCDVDEIFCTEIPLMDVEKRMKESLCDDPWSSAEQELLFAQNSHEPYLLLLDALLL